MSEASGFQANLQRGRLLRDQGRYADAEKFLRAAIAADVSSPEAYFHLALCYCNWGDHHKQALELIDRAIALDPGRPGFFGLRAWILVNAEKYREALPVTDQALALDPENLLALNARARAHLGLHEWPVAESWARHTLSLDAENKSASNVLAIALRQQGRLEESDAVSATMLARVPEDPIAHNNAGWSALRAGDYRRANEHFLEALRLDPTCDNARSGLLHAFNSRVWLYRVYYQYLAWMSSHTKNMQYVIWILIYIAYRFLIGAVNVSFGSHAFAWIIVIVSLYFVLLGYGRSFANFFLFLDRFARHAISPKQRTLSFLAAGAYALLLTLEALNKAWLQFAIMLIVPACFLWAVLQPRLQDAFARR